MSTTFICSTNNLAAATLSTGSAEAGMDASQLQNDQGSPSTAWQTAAGFVTSAGGAWLLIDAGDVSTAWRIVAAARVNWTTSAQVRVRIGNTVSGGRISGTTSYDSGTISAGIVAGYGQCIVIAPADALGRYCELAIDDSTNPDGFINVPLVFAGPAWIPERPPSWQSTFGRNNQVDEVVTRGGQEYPTLRWVQRQYQLFLDSVGSAEVFANLDQLDRVARAGGNVLFVPDATSATLQQEAIFGRLKPAAPISFPYQAADRRAWQAALTERL